MVILAILFVIGAIAMFAVVVLGSVDAHVMPFSCPRCHHSGGESIAGKAQSWYVPYDRRVRCRNCNAYFREAPNGMLVEDR